MKLAYYGGVMSPNIIKTPEGYLICKNVPIGRLGGMQYLPSDLGITTDSNDPITVTRDENALFEIASIASFEGKPVTDGHPPDDVDSANYANYAKGHAQNVRRGSGKDADKMLADLVITDPNLINIIENNQKREISSGYSCTYCQNENGTYSQLQIRGNHIAVVDEGRAGKSVCIKDSVGETKADATNQGGKKLMSNKSSKIASILNLFGKSVKDAKTIDEMEQMTEDAVSAIEGVSEENPKEKPKGKETVKDEAFSGEGELIASIKALTEAVSAMNGNKTANDMNVPSKQSEIPTEDGEDILSKIRSIVEQHNVKEPSGNVDDPITAMIEELTGKDIDNDGDGTVSDEDMAQQEEALTVSAETLDAVGTDNSKLEAAVSKDAAIKILKNARPAIAAIKDNAERKRVTDALLYSINGYISNSKKGSTMSSILKSTEGSARKNANDAKTNVFDIDAQQSIYDKLNPHLNKGGK